jgi:glutamine amidotransferase
LAGWREYASSLPWVPAFTHNGTLPRFDDLRPEAARHDDSEHRAAIRGETDSEHIFHMILSMHEATPTSIGLHRRLVA